MVEQKLNEFEPASYEEWLKLVDRDLKGAPFDKKLVKRVAGIDVLPLYMQGNASGGHEGLPGLAPFTRGSHSLGQTENGWDVRQQIAQPDLASARRAISDELSFGTTSLLLRFEDALRGGLPDDAQPGIPCRTLADLEQLLLEVSLDKTPIALDAGAGAAAAAAGLFALAKKRGLALKSLAGSLGLDPLASLVRSGNLPSSLAVSYAALCAVAAYTSREAPSVRSVCVDTAPYHDAGADAASEVALALATGLEYLRVLTDGGLSVDAAAKQIEFRFRIGRDFFLEIAKLRAARSCWSRIVSAAGGGSEAQAMFIHASTSTRTKTARDPWVNLLRATAESFSAAVAGADAITTGAFDVTLGASDEFARHLARNTQHLLRHEAQLARVIDPSGGSFYLETLTDKLARESWTKLQAFEKAGPLSAQLMEGKIQSELAKALEADRKAVETRKIAITGVNEFPNVREDKVTRTSTSKATTTTTTTNVSAFEMDKAIAALAAGASFAELTVRTEGAAKAPVLTRARLSAPFEALRDISDRALETGGSRPKVFLANLGPIPEHKARAQFAQNFVEAGGFEALSNDGFATAEAAAAAFAASGAQVCCLCSSDEVYATLAVDAAKAIAAHKPAAIVLAGNPGEHEARYREAGITHFIFMGLNLVDSLRSLLERAGAV